MHFLMKNAVSVVSRLAVCSHFIILSTVRSDQYRYKQTTLHDDGDDMTG